MKVSSEVDVTGVVVSYKVPGLLRESYGSVRSLHPEMPIIVVDGSPEGHPGHYAARECACDRHTALLDPDHNIGHGRGMHAGILASKTPFVLLFDSDVRLLRNMAVKEMLCLMEHPDVFGTGWVFPSNRKGELPFVLRQDEERILYLHPAFAIIRREKYIALAPFRNHGAPCLDTMVALHEQGCARDALRYFPAFDSNYNYVYHRWGGSAEHYRTQGLPQRG